MSCSQQTVNRWANAAQIIDIKKRNKGFARAPIITPKLKKDIDQLLNDRCNKGSRILTPILNKRFNIDISARSIRRFQKFQGFKFGLGVGKLNLTPSVKIWRLQSCQEHSKDSFRRFIFTDSKYFIIGTKGLRHRIRGCEKPCEVERWGDRFLIWWGLSYHRIYPPQVVESSLNTHAYVDILQKMLGKDYDKGNVLIQDRATPNRSVMATKWLDEHHIKYFKDWPPKGVDINVIENVWGTLEQDKRKQDFYDVAKMQMYVMKKNENFPLTNIKRRVAILNNFCAYANVVQYMCMHLSYIIILEILNFILATLSVVYTVG